MESNRVLLIPQSRQRAVRTHTPPSNQAKHARNAAGYGYDTHEEEEEGLVDMAVTALAGLSDKHLEGLIVSPLVVVDVVAHMSPGTHALLPRLPFS